MRVEGPVYIYFTLTVPRQEKQGTYIGVFFTYTQYLLNILLKTMLYFHREVVDFF